MLSGLVPASQLTERLFDDEMLERFRHVMPVMDMLNRKYGRDTVRLAVANPKGRWGRGRHVWGDAFSTCPVVARLISRARSSFNGYLGKP
jgi:hypothetical protein